MRTRITVWPASAPATARAAVDRELDSRALPIVTLSGAAAVSVRVLPAAPRSYSTALRCVEDFDPRILCESKIERDGARRDGARCERALWHGLRSGVAVDAGAAHLHRRPGRQCRGRSRRRGTRSRTCRDTDVGRCASRSAPSSRPHGNAKPYSLTYPTTPAATASAVSPPITQGQRGADHLRHPFEVRARDQRRIAGLHGAVIGRQHLVIRHAEQRCVTSQVAAREHRRAERREVVLLEGNDHDCIELQFLGDLLDRQSALLALVSQPSTRSLVGSGPIVAGRAHWPLRSASIRSCTSAELANSILMRCAYSSAAAVSPSERSIR